MPFDLGAIRAEGVNYVVVHYGVNPEHELFYQELKKSAMLAHRVSPYKEASKDRSIDPFAVTCAPYSWKELFSRERLGGVLEIYSLKEARV